MPKYGRITDMRRPALALYFVPLSSAVSDIPSIAAPRWQGLRSMKVYQPNLFATALSAHPRSDSLKETSLFGDTMHNTNIGNRVFWFVLRCFGVPDEARLYTRFDHAYGTIRPGRTPLYLHSAAPDSPFSYYSSTADYNAPREEYSPWRIP